jgi:mRNA interferase HigB
MQIHRQEMIPQFIERFPDAGSSLTSWFAHVNNVSWKNPAEVKSSYSTSSILKENRVVFNIQHNKYRMVVKINYPFHIVEIRFIGTHKEYDRIEAETI